MKFSLVDGERREAEKGLLGACIGCGKAMTAKCGLIKVNHWAHKSKCQCDHWWENETEWHRKWKNHFPVECQENRFQDANGEWHIADVKTSQGWVLEFQNSPISIQERDSRITFYKRIIWIVNGTRLKRDKINFFKSLNDGMEIEENHKVRKVFTARSSLLQKWSNCNAVVFFDFGEESKLWCLYPTNNTNFSFITPVTHEKFINWHYNDLQIQNFLIFLKTMKNTIESHFVNQERLMRRQVFLMPLNGFQRHLARRRVRRRF